MKTTELNTSIWTAAKRIEQSNTLLCLKLQENNKELNEKITHLQQQLTALRSETIRANKAILAVLVEQNEHEKEMVRRDYIHNHSNLRTSNDR